MTARHPLGIQPLTILIFFQFQITASTFIRVLFFSPLALISFTLFNCIGVNIERNLVVIMESEWLRAALGYSCFMTPVTVL